MTASTILTGLRVLVVEDDMLIAMLVEEALQSLGCLVIGPIGKLDGALRLANDEPLDAAILDVNIRGDKVFPVAEQLMSRGVPFAFASGYGDWALPEIFRNQPRLTKPFTVRELETRMQGLCNPPCGAAAAVGSPA